MEIHKPNSGNLIDHAKDYSLHDKFAIQSPKGKLFRENLVDSLESDVINSDRKRTFVMKSNLDNGALLIESIRQIWVGSYWVNSTRSLHTYNENNDKVQLLNQIWNDTEWIDNSRETYTYDNNFNRTEWMVQYGRMFGDKHTRMMRITTGQDYHIRHGMFHTGEMSGRILMLMIKITTRLSGSTNTVTVQTG